MKIFANQAQEISDNQDPTANSRYSDNSTNYEQGFKFGTPLNSAIINGFLHSASSELERKMHVKVNINYNFRYNSPSEIINSNYQDNNNYILKNDIHNLIDSRFSNKTMMLSSTVLLDEGSSSNEGLPLYSVVRKQKAFHCGGDLPVRIFSPRYHVDEILVYSNSLTLLCDTDGNKIGGDFLDCVISGQGEFAIAIPYGDDINPRHKTVRLRFTSNLTYRDTTLSTETYYEAFKRVRLFISGNKLLICEGLKGISSTSNETPEYILEHSYSEE